MTAGAARRILDSANSRDKNSTKGCVYCSEGERGHLRRNLIFRKMKSLEADKSGAGDRLSKKLLFSVEKCKFKKKLSLIALSSLFITPPTPICPSPRGGDQS